MIANLGQFALGLALVFAIAEGVLPVLDAGRPEKSWIDLAPFAAIAHFVYVAAAFIALAYAHLGGELTPLASLDDSYAQRPWFNRLADLWNNYAALMLLWAFVLALLGALAAWFGGRLRRGLRARMLVAQGVIGAGLLLIIIATSNPFARALPTGQAVGLDVAAERLASRLGHEPNDLEGWVLLGRTYATLLRYRDSEYAFGRALLLQPEDPELNAVYGQALVAAADGLVTSAAEAAFRKGGDDPRSRYYLALARAQAGESSAAYDGWLSLLADSPSDAPWYDLVRSKLIEVARPLGRPVPPTDRAEAPPTGGLSRGPTSEEIADAARLDPADRARMIANRVDRLAARLAQDESDIDGWIRLARSYAVLGRTGDARAALARATSAANGQAAAMAMVAGTAKELGLEPVTSPSPPTAGGRTAPAGPTPEQMAAAAQMSPVDRRQMIRNMVDGLASHLNANPSDFEGWLRLAQSYRVLGETDAAKGALFRAANAAGADTGRIAQVSRLSLELGIKLEAGAPAR
ncbi:MAG: hypothetical protein HYR63_22980 [Proteobacteria bacterium]|nr:hypothetical protein [Pseudomonadota bacterium]